MGKRGFILVVIGLALLLLAAKSPLGGIMGFFAGIAIAFFIAGPAMLAGLGQDGFTTIATGLAIAWGGLVLLFAALALRELLAGKPDGARGRAATALVLIAVPLALWWSNQTLQEMWP